MSLRFIIGRAGSGKTRRIYDEVVEELKGRDERPVLVLVPEQATFRTEREILEHGHLRGSLRLRVLGFKRLAYEVLRDVGGMARPRIDELGKRMVLRRTLGRHLSELTVFRSLDTGTVDRLCATLSELHRYRITPADLEARLEELRRQDRPDARMLCSKLQDLLILFEETERLISDRLDPDQAMLAAAAKLPLWPFTADAAVFVDGFSGFTPQERAVLESLVGVGGRTEISLCLPPGMLGLSPADAEAFEHVLQTYYDLSRLASEKGLDCPPPWLLQPETAPRFVKPSLEWLERAFPSFRRAPWPGATEGVYLRSAANPRAEVEWVVREIIRLCREEGYRWRDCAVIARDLQGYEDLVRSAFTAAGIACFVDSPPRLAHHPLIELVRSSLEIIESNWSYEPVFSCLKTDLPPLDRDEVDLLENYVLAHGIRGSRWTDGRDWDYRRQMLRDDQDSPVETEDLARVNETRRKVVDCLGPFHAVMTVPGLTVGRACAALIALLEALEAREKLAAWQSEALDEGRLTEAQEHGEIWDKMMDVLEQLAGTIGDEETAVGDFLEIIESALQSLDLGIIPPGMDAVTVGGVERSRFPSVRAAFVIGLNDGIFPSLPAEDIVFSDAERRFLSGLGLEMAPTSRELLLRERFFAYQALSRASEYLSLSWVLTGGDGSAASPSMIVSRVREIFPGLAVGMWPADPCGDDGDRDFVCNEPEAVSCLVSRVRMERESGVVHTEWRQLQERFAAGEGLAGRILSSLEYSNRLQPLSRELMRRACGPELRGSISSLESYAACPFSYFASRLLHLQERAVFKLEAVHTGVFKHAAMRDFVRLVREERSGWEGMDLQESAAMMRRICDDLVPRLQGEIMLSSRRYAYMGKLLSEAMEEMALYYAETAGRSACFPAAVEIAFGEEGGLPPLVVDLGGGCSLRLSGRIDRLDMNEVGEWLIIDYKSSPRIHLKPDMVLYGLSLQLPVYALVLGREGAPLAISGGLPIGLFYAPLHDPVPVFDAPVSPEEALARRRKEMRMSGLFHADRYALLDRELLPGQHSPLLNLSRNANGLPSAQSGALGGEELQSMMEHAGMMLRRLGREIIDGRLEIAPYRTGRDTACSYCKFRPVCGFEPLLPGNAWRRLPGLKTSEALRRMVEGTET